MHVLYLHQYFTTPRKGGGTRSYEFARRLVARGHRVTMITGNNRLQEPFPRGKIKKEINIEGIRVIVLPVDYSNYMSAKERIKSFLRYAWLALRAGWGVESPDLVFATSTPLTVGIPGLLLKLRHRVPLIFEVRDLWPEAPVQMGVFRSRFLVFGLRLLEWAIYRFSRHIVALSPGMAEGVESRGISRSKITVIPNSSDTGFFRPEKPDPGFVEKWGLQGRFVVAYAGAMGEANGLDLVAEAAEQLQEKGRSDVVFALAGEGKARPVLEEAVKRKKLENVLVMGPQDKYTVAKLYHAAGAALVLFRHLPVLQTNSPNKFFDALAAGVPVVANMDGWIQELLKEHQAGVPVPPQNPGALMEAVEFLADNPQHRSRLAEGARVLAETRFDRDILARELEEVMLREVTK